MRRIADEAPVGPDIADKGIGRETRAGRIPDRKRTSANVAPQQVGQVIAAIVAGAGKRPAGRNRTDINVRCEVGLTNPFSITPASIPVDRHSVNVLPFCQSRSALPSSSKSAIATMLQLGSTLAT